MASPVQPSRYEILPAATLSVVPVAENPSLLVAPFINTAWYSQLWIPTYTLTPARSPLSLFMSYPPDSVASHAHSSSIRCCGSIVLASRGDTPKKLASNSSIPSTNPPHLLTLFPSPAFFSQFHRDIGTTLISSAPFSNRPHSASSVHAVPYRHAPPHTTAVPAPVLSSQPRIRDPGPITSASRPAFSICAFSSRTDG